MMENIQARKAVLRNEIDEKLLQLKDNDKKLQSEKVESLLFNLPEFLNSKRVSIYLSTDNEINTENILRKLFELGKTCFVPRYHGNVMQMVKLDSMQDWDNLPMTKWKIKQPKLADKRENAIETGGLDLIIMPGVAFTRKGNRLGHGKGYYDSFLTSLKKIQEKPPFTVALAFNEQVFNEIPFHEYDVVLNKVLCAN